MQHELNSRFHIDFMDLAAVYGKALYGVQLFVACAAPEKHTIGYQQLTEQETH